MNLYGFAGGDPVNFSDPFGLCPPKDQNTSDCRYPDDRPLEEITTTRNIIKAGAAVASVGTFGRIMAAGIDRVAGNETNPLTGTRYTGKVRQQMRSGDNHAFPLEVDNFAADGTQSTITGGDRIVRTKIELRGAYRGKDGTFEWIIEPDKTINHRIFKPNAP